MFVIPYKINTLAQYIAMYDDLYCPCVYLACTQNPFFSLLKRNTSHEQYLAQLMKQNLGPEEWGRYLTLMDDQI